MTQSLALSTLVVRDYDEAIGFYVDKLGFILTRDDDMGGGKRWVVVTPPGSQGGLLLAKAVGDVQAARIGDQTGGRVGFFLHTDDFDGDHARMSAAGVKFLEAPRREVYATVAVFEDLYGNRWDLLQPK
ncbi:VOC family protein [Phenylobacterium sp.]|uniref:VOC family protein n=1 Tax=Phenylobacterium sp. TaxID=1871053 RepID=UPI0027306740|nr:VOC family protein [Phenylobacterium sp.]MDP1601322.1 VOC family protein [Phenylobacterium sp.]MDP3591474.1 VOC family protein [Phenylobacterium sp.]